MRIQKNPNVSNEEQRIKIHSGSSPKSDHEASQRTQEVSNSILLRPGFDSELRDPSPLQRNALKRPRPSNENGDPEPNQVQDNKRPRYETFRATEPSLSDHHLTHRISSLRSNSLPSSAIHPQPVWEFHEFEPAYLPPRQNPAAYSQKDNPPLTDEQIEEYSKIVENGEAYERGTDAERVLLKEAIEKLDAYFENVLTEKEEHRIKDRESYDMRVRVPALVRGRQATASEEARESADRIEARMKKNPLERQNRIYDEVKRILEKKTRPN